MEKAKKGILILEDLDSTLGQKQRTLKGLCHKIFPQVFKHGLHLKQAFFLHASDYSCV